MVGKLTGKVAVVTGGGRGIGKAEALALAAEGATVVVNDLGAACDGTAASASPADEVVSAINRNGGVAIANYDTVATPEGGESIIKTAIDNFGRLDILVNNAGNTRPHMLFNMPEEDWDSVIKVHLYGHFNCTKPACIWFRRQGSGRIINTSSEAGIVATTGVANYCAAKGGIISFTRAVALEMMRYGVTCNCICPRALTRIFYEGDFPKLMSRTIEDMKMREMEPEDIAPLVLYLATNEAANVNGCVFVTYGGKISLSEPVEIRTVYKRGRWTVGELCDVMPQMVAGEASTQFLFTPLLPDHGNQRKSKLI